MAAHMVFWTLQLILIEKGCYNCCRREPNKEVSQEACDLDDDVKMEEVRVIGMANKKQRIFERFQLTLKFALSLSAALV